MSDFKKNDTTIGDVLSDHFGVTNFREARERRNDAAEKERIEQMHVANGIAPSAPPMPSGDAPTIIPPAATPVVTSSTSTDNKCPSCGATLAFDPASGGLVCNFCGATVEIKTMPAAPGLGYTLEDLNYTSGQHYLRMVNKLIVCGTCGGKFVADQNAMSGLCPYCGSNSITETTGEGMLEPTGVIPFKISKEQAQAMFKDWVVKRKMAPMDIAKNAEITDLTGVYVPYWIFDCDTYSPYSGKFGIDYGSGDDSYTKWHKATGVCQLPIRNLTLIATSRLENDSFWKGVSNFDLNFMKRYDPNLLAGFWSESYTIDGQQAWVTAMDKIYNRIRGQIKAMEGADHVKNLDFKPEASNIRAKYVLAPIWITSFDYKGTVYRVLINGQTGSIAGTWPKSFKKFFMILGIIAGAVIGSRILLFFFQWLLNQINTGFGI